MRVLVTVLTSSKPALARLAYDSIVGQIETDWEFDVAVVVNSRRPEHHGAIVAAFADAPPPPRGTLSIVETESNGWPGRGHNSLLALFRAHPEYDYLVPLDGDDAFYPITFHQLQKFLPLSPHVVAIQANDKIARGPILSRHFRIEKDWALLSWFEDQENWWRIYALRNPFVEPMQTCGTPARPVLLHRAVLEWLPPEPYGEDLALFDDMVFFLHACEAWYKDKAFRLFFTSNTYLYVHNDMNADSATYAGVDYPREERLIRALPGFEEIRRWQMGELPHARISNPARFGTAEKIRFVHGWTRAIDRLVSG
jgi:hypothetical protein